ncbi:MAG: murein biosynthesis integral membrane protein MurJ [Candidatus Puniceispirillales bacterium]
MISSPKGLLSIFSRVSVFTALSRIFGFTRDIILAIVLGLGPVSDAFFVAFKLPNLFRRLTAEGAMASAFIPGYTGVEQKHGIRQAMRMAGEVQSLLIFVLILIVIIFELFMPVVITLIAPGFSYVNGISRMDTAVQLARITMPYLPLISLLALWISIGNIYSRFSLGASVPVIMNAVMISGALLAWWLWPDLSQEADSYHRAMIVAIAVTAGGVIKLVIIGAMLIRIGRMPPLMPPFTLSGISPHSRQLWRRFFPAALGAAGTQINLLIDTILASLLAVGSISQLYFADRIAQLPLGVVGIALGVALLPTLSRLEQADEVDVSAVRSVIHRGLLIGMLAGLPAMAGVLVIAEHLIRGLFAYGAFDLAMVYPTALVLMAYGVGIPAFILVKTLQPAFYAAGDTKTPMWITIISVIINIGLSLILMQFLAAAGLALATSISLWCSTIILAVILVMRQRINATILFPMLKIILITMIMAGGIYVLKQALPTIPAWQSLFILIAASLIIFAPLVIITGIWKNLKT